MPKRLIRQKTAAKAPLDAAIINTPSKEFNGTNVIEALKGILRGHHVPPIVVSDDIDLEQQSLDSAEGMENFMPRSFKKVELLPR